MTYEEAREINKKSFLVDTQGNTDAVLSEANRLAIEALEKANKYRWHDLRKDPDDLPKIMEQVLLKVQIGSDDYEYVTASRITGNDNGWTCFGYPVAWKEIEVTE